MFVCHFGESQPSIQGQMVKDLVSAFALQIVQQKDAHVGRVGACVIVTAIHKIIPVETNDSFLFS